jgi:SAM-dependent methyltransferase
MSTVIASEPHAALISHKSNHEGCPLSVYQARLESKDTLALPLEEEKELLNQLYAFEFGRFLLEHKGLNGYWTAYAILHGPRKKGLPPLEQWILHHAPVLKATRERFQIFRRQLQKHLKSHMTMASIPCGLMDDLLGLDYTKASDVTLVGVDLDLESLSFARANAEQYGYKNVLFLEKDAWNLEVAECYDIITSNGLNIYQPDDEKVVTLYQEFYKALKKDGILITSFLTPPPALSPESTWKNYVAADALKQKAIFADIIQAGWQTFRTEDQTRQQLEKAGFTVVDIIYDTQGMFPTVVAKKASA